MSGPKIVRIVSREEVVALCAGLLARLGAVSEDWIRVGQRNALVSEDEIAAVRGRHAAIQQLLQQDRFIDIQKAVPAEIARLQGDLDQRLARAASAAAAARASDRRRSSVAASVLAALDRAGTSVPPELRQGLERAAAGEGDGGPVIVRGFALLAQDSLPAISQHQRDLAAALKDGDAQQSFHDWLATQPPTLEEQRLARLDNHIATLRGLTDDATCAPFEARVRQLEGSKSDVAFAPKLDSLVVELARVITEARELHAARTRLRMLAAELAQVGTEEAKIEVVSILAGVDGTLAQLVSLEARASEARTTIHSRIAAHARRLAVLEGLAGLGYQVSEQMETAWVTNGRIVLRKTAEPGYGVEIGGGADAARVQLRTVAFRGAAATADPVRDRDAETIWCGDLEKLRSRFAAVGGDVAIEQALAVGAVPLRVIADVAEPGREGMQSSQAGPMNQQQLKLPG